MKLSVIIPTHNRAAILKTCLERLMTQQGAEFEVIVVDDGSTDATKTVVERFQSHHKGTAITYLYQKNARQGTARNNGLKHATGEIICFIGDDILVESGYLMRHHDAHGTNPGEEVVVLGRTTWDPALEITPYMEFLETSGWQFAYHLLTPGFVGHLEPYKFFYTSNISLKRSLLQKETFNEQFTEYGWEDIELGYRLWKQHGMQLFYEPEAQALHHHFLPEDTLSKKMRSVGRSAVQFQKLHPEVPVVPRGWKAAVLGFINFLSPLLPVSRLFGKHFYYKLKSWQQFWRGMKEAS